MVEKSDRRVLKSFSDYILLEYSIFLLQDHGGLHLQKSSIEFNDYLNNRVSPIEKEDLRMLRKKCLEEFLETS